MIKVENLRLNFSGGFNLSIEKLLIEEGTIFTIIGPNGAGKSTFLNIIALLQKPDCGTIEIRGENILNLKNILAFRRRISFVFSRPYLFNDTVYNNIALPLRFRGALDRRLIDDTLAFFRISHLKDRRAASLSQGQMHRAALARAFITRPEIVLLDEPFLSLDERFKEPLINDLRGIIKLNKTTAIFITQDQFEALSLADDMAVMINGRIPQHSKPEDIFTKPLSREIADFVGVETVIEGRIIRKEENLCFIEIGDKILEAISEYNAGDDVYVCIRPENVVISRHEEETSARNHFKARISRIEPWRLEYKLALDCGFELSASVTKQSVEDLSLRDGNDVFASFKATAIHLIKRGL